MREEMYRSHLIDGQGNRYGERVHFDDGTHEDLMFAPSKPLAGLKDNVIQPSHYKRGDLECFDAIRAAVKGLEPMESFMIGNVMKYVWRWKDKNGVEDLRKAKEYLERLIKELEDN